MAAPTPDPTVLITGAARRIGGAIAHDLAQRGWRICIHYHDAEEQALGLVETLVSQGRTAIAIGADLAEPDAEKGVFSKCNAELGTVTCLINNAAVFEPDEITSVSHDTWSAHIDVNLRAPVFLSKCFAEQLPDDTHGNIINMLDQRVWKPTPQFLSYTTSKSALFAVTRTLAQALAPWIRVNGIGPGPTLANTRQTDEDLKRQIDATLLRRGTSPEDITACVRFILDSPALTGQMIAPDAGQHLAWQTADVIGMRE